MRTALLILPLLVTACATPREACISSVTREMRVLDRLIVETRQNLTRGYALEERQQIRTVPATCERRSQRGFITEYDCTRTETTTRREPVAIDLNAERAKLESLEERQAQNQSNAQSGIAQCIAANPE